MKQLETDGAIVSAVDQVHIMVGKFDYRSDLALVAPPLDWTDGVNADETRGITNLQSFFFYAKLAAMQPQGFIPHEMEGRRYEIR